MLKFVNSFKKNNTNSLAQNGQQVAKKPSAQLSEDDIDTQFPNNSEHSSKKKLPLKRRRLLFFLSIVLTLVAIAVLIALIVCIVKFTGESDRTSTNSEQLHTNQSVSCDQNGKCEQGFLSLLIDNHCLCHSPQTSNFQQGILLCFKMGTNLYKCECKLGYQWSIRDNMCMDVDECQLRNMCSDGVSDGCINKMGSYECRCKSGFRWSRLFQRCVDINECLDQEREICREKNSECVNTIGGYKCKCKAGYSKISNGSESECRDYDECKWNRNVCSNSTCRNLDGSYECCSVFQKEYECINCGFQYFKPSLNFSSQKVASRIIGGVESNPHSWPWIVSIGINYRFILIDMKKNTINVKWLNISHICGGTLISKYTVLTAAHCLYNLEARISHHTTKSSYLEEEYLTDLAKTLTVYAGIHDQDLDKKNRNFTFKVRKIHIHNNFDSKMLLNDIAMLILDKSVRKSNRVNWACLGSLADFRFPSINTTLYAAGFGSTNQSNLLVSNFLRQVDLKLLDFSNCGLVTQTMISNPQSQFCAGYLNGLKDTCTGDSGSPILYKYNSRWFVIGIVSYGLGCAQSFKPGINTNVSYYLNWINQKLKD